MRGVVIGGIECLQDSETSQSDLPHLIIQHPANILQIVVSEKLNTASIWRRKRRGEERGEREGIGGKWNLEQGCAYAMTCTTPVVNQPVS